MTSKVPYTGCSADSESPTSMCSAGAQPFKAITSSRSAIRRKCLDSSHSVASMSTPKRFLLMCSSTPRAGIPFARNSSFMRSAMGARNAAPPQAGSQKIPLSKRTPFAVRSSSRRVVSDGGVKNIASDLRYASPAHKAYAVLSQYVACRKGSPAKAATKARTSGVLASLRETGKPLAGSPAYAWSQRPARTVPTRLVALTQPSRAWAASGRIKRENRDFFDSVIEGGERCSRRRPSQ